MKQQRVCGLILILISILILAAASGGSTVEEKDCTAVLFTLPLGAYALFTKTPITYAAQKEAAGRKKYPREP